MTIVKYRRYRDYEHQRITTNDTMMGLLAGSKLASQTLMLTAGSRLLLSEIFPSVPHIKRFNLNTETAQNVLNNAEDLLGILAVPQVLALHEDLIKDMLKLLKQNGASISLGDIGMSNIHDKFEDATDTSFPPATVELSQLVRMARNEHIHNGGKARPVLVDAIAATDPATLQVWEGITGTPFHTYQPNDPVHMGLSELIGILALTKHLAEEANQILQRALPTSAWADLAVQDWLVEGKPGNPIQRFKRLQGVAKFYYKAISLSDDDLQAAQSRAGVV
jgi:hypothetical protein